MAQCFITTYRNHYRWFDPEVTPSAKPCDKLTNLLASEEIWIRDESTGDKLDENVLENQLHRQYLQRMISTYKKHYCGSLYADLFKDAQSTDVGNQLWEYSSNLYEPKTKQKILSPLAGTRKVFGYIRPGRNYTPLTTYQTTIGKTAFKVLFKEEAKKNREIKVEPVKRRGFRRVKQRLVKDCTRV